MKPIVAANWKMNFTIDESLNLIDEIIKRSPSVEAEIIFFPNYISLQSVKQKLVDTAYMVGSQNVHHDESGAFTGEVSASMLSILDLDYVIIGHSERRQFFNESDDQVNQKIKRALDVNIKPVVCIGETIDERKSGKTTEVLNRQLNKAFDEIDVLSANKIIVAYEPVWAIGTGVSADENQVLEAHALIKQTLVSIFSENIPILYGGSVNASNAFELINLNNVDGFL
ncbi:MAG: triose-phosphate isomerase, partial [Candidatus Marinimicrobia bacterium]|nr:triose-phosphate isomerase [Candidatus Neomarinimicrobiota bacterium]